MKIRFTHVALATTSGTLLLLLLALVFGGNFGGGWVESSDSSGFSWEGTRMLERTWIFLYFAYDTLLTDVFGGSVGTSLVVAALELSSEAEMIYGFESCQSNCDNIRCLFWSVLPYLGLGYRSWSRSLGFHLSATFCWRIKSSDQSFIWFDIKYWNIPVCLLSSSPTAWTARSPSAAARSASGTGQSLQPQP